MKRNVFKQIRNKLATTLAVSTLLFGVGGIVSTTQADETCMSPYMAKIVGQEGIQPYRLFVEHT